MPVAALVTPPHPTIRTNTNITEAQGYKVLIKSLTSASIIVKLSRITNVSNTLKKPCSTC
jgi:hypothetical protein